MDHSGCNFFSFSKAKENKLWNSKATLDTLKWKHYCKEKGHQKNTCPVKNSERKKIYIDRIAVIF